MTSLRVITEGGSAVGLGHMRRCLTIAEALQTFGVSTAFYVAGGERAEAFIRDQGFEALALRDVADANDVASMLTSDRAGGVLIDSYAMSDALFRACAGRKTIVVDDLADRPVPADLVINPALEAGRLDYTRLTRGRLLLGAQYALLRSEFRNLPQRRTSLRIDRILVTLGGGACDTLAFEIARSCRAVLPAARIDVVAGPFGESLHPDPAVDATGVTILKEPNMRDVMLRADIALSSGGQTLFELAATALPAIVITTADNQTQNVAGFAAAGTIVSIGSSRDGEVRARISDACVELREPEARAQMSRRGPQLVDGRGADRVAQAIVELLRNP